MATTVLIVDDHRVFGQGLEAVLGAQPGFEAISVGSPDRVADAVAGHRPDVVIMDMRLGDVSGLDLVRDLMALAFPPRVVVLTAYADLPAMIEAIRAGAVGFVAKDASVEQLVCAIRAAMAHGCWLPADLLAELSASLSGLAPEPRPRSLRQLTARELEVLRLMVSGLDKNGIAVRLGQSPNTVRTHIRNVTAKLGCHSALEVVAVALRAGLRPE